MERRRGVFRRPTEDGSPSQTSVCVKLSGELPFLSPLGETHFSKTCIYFQSFTLACVNFVQERLQMRDSLAAPDSTCVGCCGAAEGFAFVSLAPTSSASTSRLWLQQREREKKKEIMQ
ncbi:hypothetical protein JZ751_021499 [Albula glossodonta]|uniref:Uncharacterized protein n=1 Tax=Albula glossodonta TaxID=121402 RepID=A0A8T2NL37_9TELE|nr:hypothetical protein JZ751_021499 [Albula glossodonta]